jgi:hypothetical protein
MLLNLKALKFDEVKEFCNGMSIPSIISNLRDAALVITEEGIQLPEEYQKNDCIEQLHSIIEVIALLNILGNAVSEVNQSESSKKGGASC